MIEVLSSARLVITDRESLNFPAVVFAGRTFQKNNLSSGMLRIERERIWAEIQKGTDSSKPASLILATTHRHFANYHFRLPTRHDRRNWQPAFHLFDPHLASDPKDQYAQITPLFVLNVIDLRNPQLSVVLAKLMNKRAEPRAGISIRELFAAYDAPLLRKSRS
jgi:hypothetical protein